MNQRQDPTLRAAHAYLDLLHRNRERPSLPAGRAASAIGGGRSASDLPPNRGRAGAQWAGAIIGALAIALGGSWTIPLVKTAAVAIWNGAMTTSLAISLSVASIPAAIVGTLGVIAVAGCTREIGRRKEAKVAAAQRSAAERSNASVADDRSSTGQTQSREPAPERTAGGPEAPAPAPAQPAAARAVQEMGRGLAESASRATAGTTARTKFDELVGPDGTVSDKNLPRLAEALVASDAAGTYLPDFLAADRAPAVSLAT
jgi:hypothetical protein